MWLNCWPKFSPFTSGGPGFWSHTYLTPKHKPAILTEHERDFLCHQRIEGNSTKVKYKLLCSVFLPGISNYRWTIWCDGCYLMLIKRSHTVSGQSREEQCRAGGPSQTALTPFSEACWKEDDAASSTSQPKGALSVWTITPFKPFFAVHLYKHFLDS